MTTSRAQCRFANPLLIHLLHVRRHETCTMTITRITHIRIALLAGVVMSAVMWLFLSANSLFREFGRDHETLGIALFSLNYPALLVGMFISGNPHGPSEAAVYTGVFVEWAIIGFCASWLVARLTRQTKPSMVNSDA